MIKISKVIVMCLGLSSYGIDAGMIPNGHHIVYSEIKFVNLGDYPDYTFHVLPVTNLVVALEHTDWVFSEGTFHTTRSHSYVHRMDDFSLFAVPKSFQGDLIHALNTAVTSNSTTGVMRSEHLPWERVLASDCDPEVSSETHYRIIGLPEYLQITNVTAESKSNAED